MVAKAYNSGFKKAHDTYNGISASSNGNIYYSLSSNSIDVGGKLFVYEPLKDTTRLLADLTELCGETHSQSIPQGKVHTRFYECHGKLYFATHVGFYELIDGVERMPVTPPKGYKLYPGGHILSFDLITETFENLAILPDGEGMVSMTMDAERSQIYGISWPGGNFLHYDVTKNTLRNLGKISENGEAGKPGSDFRSLCRSLIVDPVYGTVYFSTSDGDIHVYDPKKFKISKFENVNLRLDYFGKYDPRFPGNMAYNWRKIIWYKPEEAAYGIHGNSGYLFRFEPKKGVLEIVERLTSIPSKKSGMFDQFSYGYLGFILGPDGHTLYYLTGGPIYENGFRVSGVDALNKGGARGEENLHLITFNISRHEYKDHGPIFYSGGERPSYVNSIAIGQDGSVYFLARITENGNSRTDLVKITIPNN